MPGYASAAALLLCSLLLNLNKHPIKIVYNECFGADVSKGPLHSASATEGYLRNYTKHWCILIHSETNFPTKQKWALYFQLFNDDVKIFGRVRFSVVHCMTNIFKGFSPWFFLCFHLVCFSRSFSAAEIFQSSHRWLLPLYEYLITFIYLPWV